MLERENKMLKRRRVWSLRSSCAVRMRIIIMTNCEYFVATILN
jgi:hypothetical protein